jgi:hypothetical protein
MYSFYVLCARVAYKWEKLPGKCYNFWSKSSKTSLRKYVEKKKVCREERSGRGKCRSLDKTQA